MVDQTAASNLPLYIMMLFLDRIVYRSFTDINLTDFEAVNKQPDYYFDIRPINHFSLFFISQVLTPDHSLRLCGILLEMKALFI